MKIIAVFLLSGKAKRTNEHQPCFRSKWNRWMGRVQNFQSSLAQFPQCGNPPQERDWGGFLTFICFADNPFFRGKLWAGWWKLDLQTGRKTWNFCARMGEISIRCKPIFLMRHDAKLCMFFVEPYLILVSRCCRLYVVIRPPGLRGGTKTLNLHQVDQIVSNINWLSN